MKSKLFILVLVLITPLISSMILSGQDPNPWQPGPRMYHQLVMHDSSQSVFMFGGLPQHGWGGDLAEVWNFDLQSRKWKYVCPYRAMIHVDIFGNKTESTVSSPVLDSESNVIICMNRHTKTWAFHPGTMEWELMSPDLKPSRRCGQSMVYDSESDRVILFGGFGCEGLTPPFDDMWAYDYNTDTWEELLPDTMPQERMYAPMVYNSQSDRVMLWGGRHLDNTDYDFHDTTMWEYDYNSNQWFAIENNGGPGDPYGYAQMIYHPQKNEVFLYGGGPMIYTFFGFATDECWVYHCSDSTWMLVPAENTPAKISVHSMAYNHRNDEILLFGGEINEMYSNIMLEGTWLMEYRTKTWNELPFAFSGYNAILGGCQLDSLVLGGDSTAWGGSEPYDYIWSGSAYYEGNSVEVTDLLDDVSSPNPILTGDFDSLTLYLEILDDKGLSARDTVSFLVAKLKNCSNIWSDSIRRGESVQLDHCIEGGLGPLSYNWQPGTYLSDTAAPRPLATTDSSITFTLVVTDSAGCEISSEFEVKINSTGIERPNHNSALVEVTSFADESGVRLLLNNKTWKSYMVRVVGMDGKIKDQWIIGPGTTERSFGQFSAGIYLYQVLGSNEQVRSGKFMIQ